MKRSSQKSSLRFWLTTIGVAFVLGTSFPLSAEAQTNTFPSTGNVGIGTTTPGSLLEVKQSQNAGTTVVIDNGHTAPSNAAYSGFFFKQAGINRFFFGSTNDGNTVQAGGAGGVQLWNFANGPMLFATNNAERMRIDAAGSVGIGTTGPISKLDISETSTSSVRGIVSTQYSNDAWGSRLILRKARDASGTSTATVQNQDSLGLILFNGFDGSAFADSSRISAITIAMLIDKNGNVGIGTTAPTTKLDVAGQIRSSTGGFMFPNGTVQLTASPGGTITGVTAGAGLTGGGSSGSVTLDIGAGTGLSVATDSVSVNYGSTAGTAVQGNTSITVAAGAGMSGGGAVTLGTGGSVTLTNADRGSSQSIFKNIANAAGTTQFSAGSNSDALRFEGTGGTSVSFDAATKKISISGPGSSGWTDSGVNVNLTNSSANVGIGTSTPSTKLQVAGGTRVDGTNGRVYLGIGAAAGSRGLEFIEENATTFSIRHHDPNVAWQNIVINPYGGNIGIGTISPNAAYKLDINGNTNVTGNMNVTGTINAKYQDVAEWVQSSQALAAGTVVVLDHTRSNQVIASSQAYDTRVAGVISLQPGIALGENGAGKVLVATTGRVKIKVDATAGPIRIGDLLVTSDKAGIAKKSEPLNLGGVAIHRPGTLIGKALEPLAKGTGEILVLLSLQ
jgi:hypothetical protein